MFAVDKPLSLSRTLTQECTIKIFVAARTDKAARSRPRDGTMPALFSTQCGLSLFVVCSGITTRLLSYDCIVEDFNFRMDVYIKPGITPEAMDLAVVTQEAEPKRIQHRDYNPVLNAFWKRVRVASPRGIQQNNASFYLGFNQHNPRFPLEVPRSLDSQPSREPGTAESIPIRVKRMERLRSRPSH